MLVLLGNLWYENKHGGRNNNAGMGGTGISTWTVDQVVTQPPQGMENRTDSSDGDGSSSDESTNDKTTNSTGSSSDSGSSEDEPIMSWRDDLSLSNLFHLQSPDEPLELILGAGQAVYLVDPTANVAAPALCDNNDEATTLLVQSAAVTLSHATAQIRQLTVQLDLDEDTTLAVCSGSQEVTSVLHYILVPSNATSSEVRLVDCMVLAWKRRKRFKSHVCLSIHVLAGRMDSHHGFYGNKSSTT